MSLPGWDSLSATSWLARWFTYAGFGALFLLGAFEILGHVYSVHESTLTDAEREREADNKRAESDARIAEAQRGAAEANKATEALRLDVATANERAAAANETAEKEKLARLQLEARLADRVISDDQRKRLVTVFRAMKGQTVDVTLFGDNPDIANVTGALLTSLRDAGVLFNNFSPLGGGSGVRGILVGASADASVTVKAVANAVVKILSETIHGGVGLWDFSQLKYEATGVGGSSPGAEAAGQAKLRIWIGPK